ncbi:MAG: carbohydrate ABC transporter permease [Ruminococcus sp.]|nr:carbohydrate ABC transporter permease [Ruminococcus sp.]
MKKYLIKILLYFIAAFFCLPMLLVVVGSLMGEDELALNLAAILSGNDGYAQWDLFPTQPSLQSYIKLLFDSPEYFNTFWNSLIMTVGTVIGQMLVGIPAAWALAQYDFKGKRILFFVYIVLMILPFQVLMLSEYIMLKSLNLLDTFFSIILPGMFSTFPVFIMHNFFSQLPKSILESARLDGAGEFKILIHIGIPCSMSGIFAAAILQFIEYWNIIEQPMMFIKEKSYWPMSLAIPNAKTENIGLALAASVLMMCPSILIFIFGKKYLEQGIAVTGLKE